jgi:GNAT superfamily N-acetyltransferase
MEIDIRTAEGEEDLSFMLALGRRLADVIETRLHSPEAVRTFQDEYSAANLNDPPINALTMIAVGAGGERFGFVHAIPGPDGITGETIGYVALLAVVEAAEGRGVAQALLASAEAWARRSGYRALSLDVFASNGRGRRFYEKSGFAVETMRMVKGVDGPVS